MYADEKMKIEGAVKRQPGATGQPSSAADYGSSVDVTTSKEHSSQSPASARLLFLVCMVEGMDIQLLPVSFKAMETCLGMTPTMLARLAICQGVAMSLSGPAWAAVVDAGGSRRALLMYGTLLWGVATMMMAFATTVTQMMALRMVVGVALASLTPVVQAIIAEEGTEDMGYRFGCLDSTTKVGAVITIMCATPISEKQIFGIEGWRVSFAVVACLSIALSALLNCCYEEKRRVWRPEVVSFSAEFSKFYRYCGIWTFRLILLQGMFGMIPWNALSFLVMFLQYCGISDAGAAQLFSLTNVGCIFGMIIGGMVADRLHKWSTNHGRVLSAQFSVFSGIPLTVLMFYFVTPDASSYGIYAILLFLMGILPTWAGVGTNKPILATLVDQDSRGSVYAWMWGLENMVGVLVGPIVVGILAEHTYGYEMQGKKVSEMSYDERMTNAHALRQALLLAITIPWTVCFVVYSLLHFIIPSDLAHRDRDRDYDALS